ncbi:hypothetical protein DEJ45_15695 [Streptomyces venezuelae]|nr:hypothetical protein DEJ45_15695 [Streptomyces venezuelae]
MTTRGPKVPRSAAPLLRGRVPPRGRAEAHGRPVVGNRPPGAMGVPPARAKPRAWGRVGTTDGAPCRA